jgi:cytochrome c553
MRTILAAALFALAATAQAQGADVKGDPKRAREKISMCQGCHGIPDYRTAYPAVYYVPMIAGQNPAYIVKALEAYKTGERNHPSMRAIAASLSAQDMADLAVYYGTLK